MHNENVLYILRKFYSAVKEDEIRKSEGKYMGPEGIVLSCMTQTQTNKTMMMFCRS